MIVLIDSLRDGLGRTTTRSPSRTPWTSHRTVRANEGSQRTRRRKPVQALLEAQMGCGTGICYGCAVFDRRGEPRLVCKDGPRFELRDIY